MKHPATALALLGVVSITSVAFLIDSTREPQQGSPAWFAGAEAGELIGHNHAVAGSGALSPEARETASASAMPLSVRWNRPRAIADYRAGWVEGYPRGLYYRQPQKIAAAR